LCCGENIDVQQKFDPNNKKIYEKCVEKLCFTTPSTENQIKTIIQMEKYDEIERLIVEDIKKMNKIAEMHSSRLQSLWKIHKESCFHNNKKTKPNDKD
jgi:hypothetical protein